MTTERTKYVLTADRFEHKAGTVCYRYRNHDYGLASDDEGFTGVAHFSMTLDPAGEGTPFFTVPVTGFRKHYPIDEHLVWPTRPLME